MKVKCQKSENMALKKYILEINYIQAKGETEVDEHTVKINTSELTISSNNSEEILSDLSRFVLHSPLWLHVVHHFSSTYIRVFLSESYDWFASLIE